MATPNFILPRDSPAVQLITCFNLIENLMESDLSGSFFCTRWVEKDAVRPSLQRPFSLLPDTPDKIYEEQFFRRIIRHFVSKHIQSVSFIFPGTKKSIHWVHLLFHRPIIY